MSWLNGTLLLIYYEDLLYHVAIELTMSLCASQSLLEMGTKDMDFVQLNQLIGRKTGGISVYPFTSPVRGKEDPLTRIIVRGKAMAPQVEDLFNLVCFCICSICVCLWVCVAKGKLGCRRHACYFIC